MSEWDGERGGRRGKSGIFHLHLRNVAFGEHDAGIRGVYVHVAVALADGAVADCWLDVISSSHIVILLGAVRTRYNSSRVVERRGSFDGVFERAAVA